MSGRLRPFVPAAVDIGSHSSLHSTLLPRGQKSLGKTETFHCPSGPSRTGFPNAVLPSSLWLVFHFGNSSKPILLKHTAAPGSPVLLQGPHWVEKLGAGSSKVESRLVA